MRILELEIQNVRGVRQLVLKPNGHNFAVTGPNGSGKSAVVDAIDFLLTGKIQRLTGKGTGGLSLKQHGPHIDTLPSDARVRAVIQISAHKEPMEISRSMSSSDVLVIPKGTEEILQPVLELAARGQHVLSRREILKYITAEAKTRAEEIQSLLNLSEIEGTRNTLVKTQNSLKAEAKTAKSLLDDAKTQLTTAAGLTLFSEEHVLKVVNDNRALLGAQPVKKLEDIKSDLVVPPAPQATKINTALAESDVCQLRQTLEDQETQPTYIQFAEEMSKLITDIQGDSMIKLHISRLRLLELGISNIDETGACPLCDKPWPTGELKAYLDEKLKAAKAAAKTVDRINELAASLTQSIVSATTTTGKLIETCRLVDETELGDELAKWKNQAESLRKCLLDPLSETNIKTLLGAKWEQLGLDETVITRLAAMITKLKGSIPKPDPKQTAWDILTRIDERLRSWNDALNSEHRAAQSYGRAVDLLQAFEESRDEVLSELFGTIKGRFVDLYRALHKDDEEAFDATLQLEGAGLDLQVDFHGKGHHPPHALHSEGHQDSMGLCLYLALAEHLNSDIISLVVLDDVVMSVDSGHRRELCRILKDQFPSKQFVITTHERAWARQLQTDGTIGGKDVYTFYNWTVEGGPRVNSNGDAWALVGEKLKNDDVPGAAHALRYGLEEFFQHVSSSLRAPVRYNWQERWELGDFMDASLGQFSTYFKKAKAAAQSWGDKETVSAIEEMESVFAQAVSNAQVEQWGINPNVHYNKWASFSKQDFEPIPEAMEELCAQFKCQQCGGILEAQGVGKEITTVRCPCGKLSLNLTRKKNDK